MTLAPILKYWMVLLKLPSHLCLKQDKPKLSKGQKRGEIRKFNKKRELWAKAHKKVKDWQFPPHLDMTDEYDAAPRTHDLFPAPPNWDQFIEKMEQPTYNENFSDQPLHWRLEIDSALDKSKWPRYGYEDFARMEQEDFDHDFKSWVKNGSASYYENAPRVSSNDIVQLQNPPLIQWMWIGTYVLKQLKHGLK
ncbi:hypothetical protein K435DRAFT_812934 [Dendrothele bispora CBS 962.96]|uniref:Uncharacterized protein n=1 Tax=Dendrothele bispora (strain CBS 962.96) TaxID=1314807 RepID=A0A4S8KMX5_DENBC|nr:hypothetical protein K435DRAFT_812934 [Dendrothele bispora CBS 962.96]